MLESGEALRLILAAIALGVTIPVLVQLFLTLRQIQATVKRIEPTLRVINQIAEHQTAPQPVAQPGAPQIAGIIAALVPTVIAAYQAFRQQASEAHQSEDRESIATRESREEES